MRTIAREILSSKDDPLAGAAAHENRPASHGLTSWPYSRAEALFPHVCRVPAGDIAPRSLAKGGCRCGCECPGARCKAGPPCACGRGDELARASTRYAGAVAGAGLRYSGVSLVMCSGLMPRAGTFAVVEELRALARRRRAEPQWRRRRSDRCGCSTDWTPDDIRPRVIRAFGVYFQLVNLAEQLQCECDDRRDVH